MAEFYVAPTAPTGSDSGGVLFAIVILLVIVFFGAIAYTNGWFSGRPAAATPNPGSSINIMTPFSPSTPTPDPTPITDPAPITNPAPAPTSSSSLTPASTNTLD